MGWDPVGWVAGGVSNAWNATGNAVGNFLAGEPIGQSPSQSPVQTDQGFKDPNANLAGETMVYGTDPNKGIAYFNDDKTSTVNPAAVPTDVRAPSVQQYAESYVPETRVTNMAGWTSGDLGDSKTLTLEKDYGYSPLQALSMQQDAAVKSGDAKAARYYQNELDKAKGDVIQGAATERYEARESGLAQNPTALQYAGDLALTSLYKSQGVVNRPGATTAELTPYRGSMLADSNIITKAMRTGDLGPYGILAGNSFSSESGGRILSLDEKQIIGARAAQTAGLPYDTDNSVRAKYENPAVLQGLGLNMFYREASPGSVPSKLLSTGFDRPGELERESQLKVKTPVAATIIGITPEKIITPATTGGGVDYTNKVVPVVNSPATILGITSDVGRISGGAAYTNKIMSVVGNPSQSVSPVRVPGLNVGNPSGTGQITGIPVKIEDLGKVTPKGPVGAEGLKDAMGNVYNTTPEAAVVTPFVPSRIVVQNQYPADRFTGESTKTESPTFGAGNIRVGGGYNDALVHISTDQIIPAKETLQTKSAATSVVNRVAGLGPDRSIGGLTFAGGDKPIGLTDLENAGDAIRNWGKKRRSKPTHSLMKRRNPIFVIRQINQITPKPTKSKSIKPTLKPTAVKLIPKPNQTQPKIKQDLKSIINIEAINKNVMPKSLGKGFAIVLSPEKLVKSIGAHTKIKVAGKATGKTKIDALGLTNIKNITENINISGFGANLTKGKSGTLGVVGNINTMLKGMLNPIKTKKVKVK